MTLLDTGIFNDDRYFDVFVEYANAAPKIYSSVSRLGKLGGIEEGALADLLLVDAIHSGNIKLFQEPTKDFAVIMKDGKGWEPFSNR